METEVGRGQSGTGELGEEAARGAARAEAPMQAPRGPITLRALLLGLCMSIILGIITPANDMALGNTFMAGNHFPLGAFLVLLLVSIPVNRLLRLTRVIRPLSAGEVIVVWCMCLASSGIPCSGLMRLLVPAPAGLEYYADEQNKLDEIVRPHLPPWLIVQGEEEVRWFFEALPEGERIPWYAWLPSICGYGIFVLMFYALMACLASLLRKQWADHERFPFPLLEVPVELARSTETPLGMPEWVRHGGFWAVTILLLVLHTIQGLHMFYPSLPSVPFAVPLHRYLTERPWRYMGWMVARTYPMMVGLSYMTRTEITFSVWFFYLVLHTQYMVRGMLGLPPGTPMFRGGPTFAITQQNGAHWGLLLWSLWVARGYIRRVLRQAFGRERTIDDSQEALPVRVALFGALASFVGCVLWFVAAGVSVLIAIWVVLAFTGVMVVLSWLVCNGGLMMVQCRWTPLDPVVGVLGTRVLSVRDKAVVPLFEQIFCFDLREAILPSILNGLRAADVGVSRRHTLGAMMLAAVAVAAVAYYFAIRVGYVWAAGTLPEVPTYHSRSVYPYELAARWITEGQEPALDNLRNILTGFAIVFGLLWLRSRLLWFPLHPAGLCMIYSYSGEMIWFSMFLGWLLKTCLLRYGGYRAMRAARPYFAGMIVGDAIAGLIWIIVGWCMKDQDIFYALLPR